MNEPMNNVDEKLTRTESMRSLVHGLPEDSVSLRWRSELNEQILAMAAQPKRNRLALLWRASAGVAVAGALAFAFIANRPVGTPGVYVPSSTPDVTAAILDAHEASYAYREMGVTRPESNGQSLVNLVDGTEEIDLGAL